MAPLVQCLHLNCYQAEHRTGKTWVAVIYMHTLLESASHVKVLHVFVVQSLASITVSRDT